MYNVKYFSYVVILYTGDGRNLVLGSDSDRYCRATLKVGGGGD